MATGQAEHVFNSVILSVVQHKNPETSTASTLPLTSSLSNVHLLQNIRQHTAALHPNMFRANISGAEGCASQTCTHRLTDAFSQTCSEQICRRAAGAPAGPDRSVEPRGARPSRLLVLQVGADGRKRARDHRDPCIRWRPSLAVAASTRSAKHANLRSRDSSGLRASMALPREWATDHDTVCWPVGLLTRLYVSMSVCLDQRRSTPVLTESWSLPELFRTGP
jgi:hypothetical protein